MPEEVIIDEAELPLNAIGKQIYAKQHYSLSADELEAIFPDLVYENEDGTKKVDVRKAFTMGGIFFGIYMAIIFPLAWVRFSPALNVVKAILITIIGASTLSSSMYSIYIAFGKKVGLAVNSGLIIGWHFLIPLGVMGMWTLMASVRIYFVGAAILFAIFWNLYEKRKAVMA